MATATALCPVIASVLKNTLATTAQSQFASSASTAFVLRLVFALVPIFGTGMLVTLLFAQLAVMARNALKTATALALGNVSA
jgi:hypothetical protein